MDKRDLQQAINQHRGGGGGGGGEGGEGGEGEGEKTVYLCGPVGFMDIVVTWLVELGVKADRIKQEAFNF